MPRPFILPALITLTILGEEYKPCSSSLCNFLQPPVTSSLLGPNIFLSTLFSNTLNLCSSLIVRDKVSHPYKTTGKIITQKTEFRKTIDPSVLILFNKEKEKLKLLCERIIAVILFLCSRNLA
jgi:hypothetical protein